jgi:hypothetical protein
MPDIVDATDAPSVFMPNMDSLRITSPLWHSGHATAVAPGEAT